MQINGGQVTGSMHKQVATLLSGSPLEGPIRRAYNATRSHIPSKFLSEATIKGRNYDILTLQIARQALNNGGSAIDVGAHEGDILRHLVKYSPGPHWAFEPIPTFAARLRRRFPDVTVEPCALSDSNGQETFHFLPSAAAYSSLIHRAEIVNDRVIKRLTVQVRTLDDYLSGDVKIAFLKIDVEGAEPAVLRGARRLLRRCQPVTVFECASAELPDCIAALHGTGLRVSFLADFLAGDTRPEGEVARLGRERGEYYYVAHNQDFPDLVTPDTESVS
jgi:FkbM family methyltransferase